MLSPQLSQFLVANPPRRLCEVSPRPLLSPALDPRLEEVRHPTLMLLARQRPRIVRRPDIPWLEAHQGQRKRSFRKGRREQQAHCGTVCDTDQGGRSRADSIDGRSHIVHPLLQRRHADHRIRGANTAFVKRDQPREPRKSLDRLTKRRLIQICASMLRTSGGTSTTSNGPRPRPDTQCRDRRSACTASPERPRGKSRALQPPKEAPFTTSRVTGSPAVASYAPTVPTPWGYLAPTAASCP